MKRRVLRRWLPVMCAALVVSAALAVSGSGQSSAPIVATGYVLSADGTEIARFSDLRAVTSEVEVTASGGPSGRETTTTAARPRPATLILRRRKTGDLALWNWHEMALRGDRGDAGRNATLVMEDREGRRVLRYELDNAFPSQIVDTTVKSSSGQALVETVTITADQLQRTAP